jgi:signal transduction histidine kinase
VPANVGSPEQPRTGYFNFVYQPLREEEGGANGVMVFGYEVTDQVLARQRVEEAVRTRDTFLSIASHELKTPLTSLSLKLQALGRALQAQPGAAFVRFEAKDLELLRRQVKRLAELVNALLDVTRIGTGRLTLDVEPVDLAELVREVAARFEHEAERAGCRLEVRDAGGLVGRWDRLRLEQVLVNLLSNALKYGAGQPVRVQVEALGERARLVVRDEGIGIDAEAQARIFEKFERAVSERHYGGLGLGLYVTRQLVEAMSGAIRVESTPGQGSTFTVELPLQPPAP